ncbi:hypothetical protein A2U01_0074080 [Trifolium medium]|uniref:Uncharacterized protein n=1 Tax=Trifolium medium TaxID=97028 RepID=A0A392SX86_9FABA|nr:hypothetical protein [Trifolium medium]
MSNPNLVLVLNPVQTPSQSPIPLLVQIPLSIPLHSQIPVSNPVLFSASGASLVAA